MSAEVPAASEQRAAEGSLRNLQYAADYLEGVCDCCSCPACNHYLPEGEYKPDSTCAVVALINAIVAAHVEALREADRA